MTKRSPSSPEGVVDVVPPAVARELEAQLCRRLERRDRLVEEARDLRRSSQDLMRRIHAATGAGASLRTLRGPARALARKAKALTQQLGGDAWREESLLEDALQEWVEASLLWALVQGDPMPTPASLGVRAEHYLLGLSDLVGELRRMSVSALGSGKVPSALDSLQRMESLLHFLMRFDYPRSMLAMKPKQDTARALLERTRADVEMARYLERFAGRDGKRSKRLGR